MTYRHFFYSLAIVSLIVSCSGGEKPEQKSEDSSKADSEKMKPECTLSHQNVAPEVLWIAYKYTSKTGVKGKFEKVEVSNTGTGPAINDVLEGAEISIQTASSNSGDATRDPKIKESFFGELEGGDIITGTVTSVTGNLEGGSLNAEISMNGMTKSTNGTYSITEDQLELKFEINVEDWEAKAALDELNKVCSDLHKGPDGNSVLWPTISVFVTTTLNKDCS